MCFLHEELFKVGVAVPGDIVSHVEAQVKQVGTVEDDAIGLVKWDLVVSFAGWDLYVSWVCTTWIDIRPVMGSAVIVIVVCSYDGPVM